MKQPSTGHHYVAPVASLHRDSGKLGQDDGPSHGSGYLLGALNTRTNMTIVVPIMKKAFIIIIIINKYFII